MKQKCTESKRFTINQEQLDQLQRNLSFQKLSKQITRNRTQSNISANKSVIAIGSQTISKIRLESLVPGKVEEKKDEKKILKGVTTSRTAQFFIKQQTTSSNISKKVHHGNYFYDKLKEIFQTRANQNLHQKKMCQDALNQIHMIATYSEFIPEVSVLYSNKYSPKLKIAFDLDETLIHSEQLQKNKDYDFQNDEFGVFIRPHCQQLLAELSQIADLFVFTSANQKYAKTIIQLLDPENRYFKAHFSRNNCVTLQSRILIKHLGILTHDLSKVVIIDNSPIFYLAQPYNGIPIAPFFEDKQDQELLKLLNFLTEKIIPSNDVRDTIRKFFQYEMFRQFTDGLQAFQILYT